VQRGAEFGRNLREPFCINWWPGYALGKGDTPKGRMLDPEDFRLGRIIIRSLIESAMRVLNNVFFSVVISTSSDAFISLVTY